MNMKLTLTAGHNDTECGALVATIQDLHLLKNRRTGNRSLEAIHGTFRGTSLLPITSPNLSFGEFLMQMNKAQSAEYVLKKIREIV